MNLNNLYNKKAFTLTEALLAITVLGIIVATMVVAMKPTAITNDALKAAGLSQYTTIKSISKTILLNHSTAYDMLTLKNTSGTAFGLGDTKKNEYFSGLYKKYLGPSDKTASSSYTNTALKNESGTAIGSLKVSSFANGVFAKGNMYVAFSLYSNCTTTASNVYDPSDPDNHSVSNSCGLIFYDVNGTNGPNVVGIDMYIVSIGKYGLK